MNSRPQKLCFVLPEYAAATHFSYVAEFAEALAKERDIFLIIEKGAVPVQSETKRRYVQRMRFAPLRFLEIFLVFIYARILGYRTQYVHYSFSAAIASGIVTRLTNGRTLYWNCGMPWLYKRPWTQEFYEHTAYHLIHRLVTGAAALIPDYVRYYHISKEKIVIVPNWIDSESVGAAKIAVDTVTMRKMLNIPDISKVLLFVHRLATRKGAHLLPEILQHLADTETTLVVVGDGPERVRIENDFAKMGLSSRVRMTGAVPQEDVIKYFAIADVFLLPSEEEGMPHVLLEAQAAGVPYVATDVGGVREMTPPDARSSIVPYRDTAQFAKKVRILIEDATRSDGVSRSLRTWVKRYDKRSVLAEFGKMLQSSAQ